jgi:hypothetical protein
MHPTLRRAFIGVLVFGIALAPTLATMALLHDILPVHLPSVLSWLLAAAVGGLSCVLLGRPLASRIDASIGLRRASALTAGVALGVAHAALAPARLLRDGLGPVPQLAWILGEEDNAQIVGVAREIISLGPSGGDLATQYGTGFMVLPTLLQRLVPSLAPEVDPRLQAVTAFTLSVALATFVLGIAMLLLAMLMSRSGGRPSPATLLITMIMSLGSTVAALAIAVVLPMRTGFLTLVWSIAWVALMAAMSAAATHALPSAARWFIAAQVVVLTLLVLRSWPFLLAATLPSIALLLRPLPWPTLRRSLRRRWYVAVVVAFGTGAVLLPYVLDSAVGEVLSYGREALTVGGSGIFADRPAVIGIAAVVLLAGLVLLLPARGPSGSSDTGARRSAVGAHRIERGAIALGIPLAVWLSWVALKVAAALLTGGELNYAGWKLFYAAVAVGAVVALPSLTGAVGPVTPRTLRVVAPLAVGSLLLFSATVQTTLEWWERTAPRTPPHAVAAIDAVRASSVDLPIRCMPQPGAAATEGARWAAYYCVRWVEDAFNEDRFHGHRFTFLETPGDSFDEAVRTALEEDGDRYRFAYPMTTGPGWFGWDGVS